jgi:hypothetical protein
MNRELRRAAERATKKLRPQALKRTSKAPQVNKPTFVEMMLAFRPIEDVLRTLTQGEVECMPNGTPIHTDLAENEAYQITPAMRGWVAAMERIHAHHGQNLDFGPLVRLCNKLDACMPITKANVDECKRIVATSKAAYRDMDIYTVKSLVKTEMIAFEFERLQTKTTH